MKIAMLSNSSKENFPNITHRLNPVCFFESHYDDYKKVFVDLSLQLEKEIFLNRTKIDLAFFVVDDELDYPLFQDVVANPWALDNAIFFTKVVEQKKKSILLWNADYVQIVNSNFFCKPETFSYFCVFHKIPFDDIAKKVQETNHSMEINSDKKLYFHFFHLASILNISINHIYYDR